MTILERLKNGEKVTLTNVSILTTSMMGNWVTVPVKELILEVRPYAQYPAAVSVRYKEPRQRQYRGYVKTPTAGNPVRLVVVEGKHENLTPGMWGSEKLSDSGEVIIQKASYQSFDPRWDEDAYGAIESSGLEVLFDGRDL